MVAIKVADNESRVLHVGERCIFPSLTRGLIDVYYVDSLYSYMDKRDIISYSSADVFPVRDITPNACCCSIFVVVCGVR